MKKVVRLNEKDIERLVKKIMTEGLKDLGLGLRDDDLPSWHPLYKEPKTQGVPEVDITNDEGEIDNDKFREITKQFGSLKNFSKFRDEILSTPKRKTILQRLGLKENEYPRGGTVHGELAQIVDEVINRINEYGDEYIEQLEQLNSGFLVTKYKKVDPPTRNDFELPKGVKVKSTVYPNK